MKKSLLKLILVIGVIFGFFVLVGCGAENSGEMSAGDSAKIKGRTAIIVQIEKDGGFADVLRDGKREVTYEGMRLKTQDVVITDDHSYLYIVIDDDKTIRLDENSQLQVSTIKDDTLVLSLQKGRLFYNVENKLDTDEEMMFTAGSITMSIRGTSGVIELKEAEDGTQSLKTDLFTGKVEIKDAITEKVEILLPGNTAQIQEGEIAIEETLLENVDQRSISDLVCNEKALAELQELGHWTYERESRQMSSGTTTIYVEETSMSQMTSEELVQSSLEIDEAELAEAKAKAEAEAKAAEEKRLAEEKAAKEKAEAEAKAAKAKAAEEKRLAEEKAAREKAEAEAKAAEEKRLAEEEAKKKAELELDVSDSHSYSPTPLVETITCPGCEKTIAVGTSGHGTAVCGTSDHHECDGKDHGTAACGTSDHHECDGKDHGTAACGTSDHHKCDGKDHGTAACGTSGHHKCDGKDHGTAACGTSDHYKCDGKDHGTAACGTSGHHKCDGKDHSIAECKTKDHYECDGEEHRAGACGVLGHYKCDKLNHNKQSCGHCITEGGDHSIVACGVVGHYSCDNLKHKMCTMAACGVWICKDSNAKLCSGCPHHFCGEHLYGCEDSNCKNGKVYCENCRKNNLFVCEGCGKKLCVSCLTGGGHARPACGVATHYKCVMGAAYDVENHTVDTETGKHKCSEEYLATVENTEDVYKKERDVYEEDKDYFNSIWASLAFFFASLFKI